MAIFSTIAGAIVTALGATVTAAGVITIAGSALLGSIAVGVVAAGLAIGTAKILGLGPPSVGGQKDPGAKIQLGPSTDNKVPRLYGRNYTGGIIIDAEIKNQNKRMAYAMVISEYSDNDTWSIGEIYRGDQKLVFGYTGTNNCIVSSVIDPNATTSTKVGIDTGKKSKYPQGRFRVRVYAGGSTDAHQIFPTTNKVPAYGSGLCQFTNWTSANTMEDLVFAIVEMDYDPENDFVGLGAITFDINNTLTEPSNVLLDYLRNDRYGAGISNTIIDISSFNDWYDYATEQVDYINAANVTVPHTRYQIDGALSTFATASENIGKICLSGGAFFTYNAKQGKFGVVVNRAATASEQANAFIFNDDNILGSISITSTDLYSLFNQIEVEYPSVNQRDQTDTYFAEIDPGIRNSNEPDNKLSYRLDMVNDRSRAAQLANIDLNQSRLSMIVELTADHSSMTVDVGDVVKLTSELYGFNNKLFRCMRAIETEGEDGVLTFKFTLLEYDDDVYGDLITQEDLPPPVTGITNWWVLNSNAVLEIGNITVVNDPTSEFAQQYYPANGAFAGNVALSTVTAEFGAIYSNTAFINVPIKPPVNTSFNQARIAFVDDSDANTAPIIFTLNDSGNSTYFADDEFFNFPISTTQFKRNMPFYLEIQAKDTLSGATSRVYTTAQLNVDHSNTVSVIDVSTFAAGAQMLSAGVSNTSIAAGTTYLKISPQPDLYYELNGVDQGVYIMEAAVTPGGTLTANTYSVAMRSNALVWYSNATSNVNVSYYGGGAQYANISSGSGIVPQIVDNHEVIMDTGILANVFPGAVFDDMVPSNVTVWLEGYNTLDATIAPRTMGDQKMNLYKISKNIIP